MHAQFDGIALLLSEVRIAHLESLAAAVRSVGEQLVDRRSAFAVRQRQARTPSASELVIAADRPGEAGEAARQGSGSDDTAVRGDLRIGFSL